MNDLFCAKVKGIVKFQDIIKRDYLNYKSKFVKNYIYHKLSLF